MNIKATLLIAIRALLDLKKKDNRLHDYAEIILDNIDEIIEKERIDETKADFLNRRQTELDSWVRRTGKKYFQKK